GGDALATGGRRERGLAAPLEAARGQLRGGGPPAWRTLPGTWYVRLRFEDVPFQHVRAARRKDGLAVQHCRRRRPRVPGHVVQHRDVALKRAVLTLWLASACAVSMPRPASAQVNVEPLRKELERERLGGRVGASLAGYRGNTEGVVMGALVLVGGHLSRHFGYVNAAGDYSRLGGSTQVAKTFGHVRHNYELLPWLWSEAFAQLESDRFRRIVLRELIGAGSRLAIVKTE